MKLYTIARDAKSGALSVFVETDIVKDAKGRSVPGYLKYLLAPAHAKAGFAIGEQSKAADNLALSVMADYFEAKLEGPQTPAVLNARAKAKAFAFSFLGHHAMAPGARYEISSEVLGRWMAVWRPSA